MKVKDVMTATSLKYCNLNTKLKEVAKTMEEGNCGVLPVLDNDEKVVGIVTDRDICLSLSKEHAWSHAHLPVSEIMSKTVHTIHEKDDLKTALSHMRSKHVGRLPVIDEYGKLTGMLSIHNLFTKSLVGNEELNHLSSGTSNIVKTVKELSSNYALRQHPHEPQLDENELPFVF